MADEPTTHNEQAPLLSCDGAQNAVRRTPLPLKQISIILFLSFCASAAVYVLVPFLNELLLSFTGGDEAKEACRTTSFLIMIVYWGRISDSLGRKPILLLSCAAVISSMLLLGMSKTFWMVVLSRSILGGFNSITAGRWFCAVECALVIGGIHWTFPRWFTFKPSHTFSSYILWKTMKGLPLPLALCHHSACIVSRIPGHFDSPSRGEYPDPIIELSTDKIPQTLPRKHDSSTPVEENSTATRSQHSTPFRTLLTPRVLLSVTNYTVLSFLTMTYLTIQPLFFAMSISTGGLALEPIRIGSILAFFGLSNAVVQAVLLGPLVRLFGLRRVLRCAVSTSIPIFLLFPLMNMFAKDWQVHQQSYSRVIMYTLLAIQFILFAIHDFGYGCLFIYITSSAPNKQSLGSINGIGQMTVGISRLVGPVFANTMLGLSIEKGWMGGYAVYFVLSVIAAGGVLLVGKLPESAWETEVLEEG
ncbi:MFS general substrate transporter [Macrolepiota fuliginosa MF-IS2]|uniref:MFS general substrate transporter n=1 Tax=Macrolepiota fuliginosa MF-IS2 TaxID=1400762 RepID=A0A9P6C974_9AGAR|nr:MFS general substrate transporter [Macrolepiota fuliginosa MF-IS2]